MTWIALFWSAWGLLSIFDHLIPGMIRFSIIAKGLTAAYRAARDWVWDQVQWLFALITIPIPELPPLWLDGLTIAGLVLAALNFESIHRYGQTLFFDFGRGFVDRWAEFKVDQFDDFDDLPVGRHRQRALRQKRARERDAALMRFRETLFGPRSGVTLALGIGCFLLGVWVLGYVLRTSITASGIYSQSAPSQIKALEAAL